tara:strand:+ start:2070 stop:2663 length:594 start_codon:yes stop_codon:yes gene_type:complete
MGLMVYSGPLLYRGKLKDEDIKKLLSYCKKDKSKEANSKLAGLIDDEYDIDKYKFCEVFNNYVQDFNACYQAWYNVIPPKLNVSEVWVNFMRAGECNPPHKHDSDFSSVFYLKIPKGLKEEVKQNKSNSSEPGGIMFHFHNPIDNFICAHNLVPSVGDFFLFPSTLIHSVNTFKSSGERISVAANFMFDIKKNKNLL